MKRIWHVSLCVALWCACTFSVLAMDTAPADAASALAVAEHTQPVVITDPAVHMKNTNKYYITSGRVYDTVTGTMEGISREKTGLPQDTGRYYYRVEKNLTGDYFYSVKAYDTDSHILIGSYFVAKDDSCVWKLQDNDDAILILGTPEKLLEKADVTVYPGKLPMGSFGILRVRMPGRLPYDIKVTSLNPSVADISEKMNIVPKSEGKADLVIDLRMGNTVRTITRTVKVIETADSSDHDSGHRPIGIGIGIGWGDGWHHHGHGGIGIWV